VFGKGAVFSSLGPGKQQMGFFKIYIKEVELESD
jgi:hypothetical protein